MIAGGSGLTPMMQVASRILSDKDDKTQASAMAAVKICNIGSFLWGRAAIALHCNALHSVQVSLVFANQSEDDIILSEDLDKMQREHDNFKVRQQ